MKSLKKFNLPFGKGVVEEEVQIISKYHKPTIQLLKFTEGNAKGTSAIRFCYYDEKGRFQRAPLIINEEDTKKLKKAVEKTIKLKKFLK